MGMYRKLEPAERMTDIEASEKYRHEYVIMRMDDFDGDTGTVLYVGDNEKELNRLLSQIDDPSMCGVIEGVSLQCTLGGIEVYANH